MKIIFASVSLLLSINIFAQYQNKSNGNSNGQRRKLIDNIINNESPELLSTYRKLHEEPELSGHEEKTSKLIATQLKTMGYDVTDHIGQYKNQTWKGYGVVGLLKNGKGPVILIRTEMDALPLIEKTSLPFASQLKVKMDSGQDVGVMHACGHDVHMTIFLGVANAMMQTKNLWHGTLLMVAQPSEEGGPGASGAEAILNDGLYSRFPKPDFILGLHQTPTIMAGKVGVLAGYTNATSRDGEIIVRGIGSHAARPQDSKDPIVLSAELIMALQTIISRENNPFNPAILTIGSIHGGAKSNIIPDQVTLKFTLRTLNDEMCDKLAASILRVAKGVGYASGLSEDRFPIVNMSKGYPSNYNDPHLTALISGVFKNAIGNENVVIADPILSGEDFSYYSLQNTIPSLFFNIGGADPVKFNDAIKTGIPLPSNHSPFMVPKADIAIPTGIKAMVYAALELLK